MENNLISETQLRALLREEGAKIKKVIVLKALLEKIDNELVGLNEVHAGGNMAPGKDGVHAGQKTAVFTKKGTHLVEDQEDEMNGDEMGGEDMGGEEVPTDTMGADSEEMTNEVPMEAPVEDGMGEEGGETLQKSDIMMALQDLGNKLGLIGTLELTGDNPEGMDVDMGGEEGSEDSMDLDVDVEADSEDANSTMDTDMDSSTEEPTEEEPIDECGDDMPMEKQNPMAENKSSDPKKQKLDEHIQRMRFLAGIK